MELEDIEQLMATQRAVRHFSDRPVDDALIARLIRAATRAPSANNRQPWRFIVVREPDTKGKLGAVFDELGQALPQGAPDRMPWTDVPALIVVCSEAGGTSEAAVAATAASIYPAVQNLLLAAHAAGLGTVMTTRWKAREAEVAPLLGLPASMTAHAIVPVGWPDRKYGRGRRLAVREVTYRERYGEPWTGAGG